MYIENWEWNYVGEAGETIAARNSHSLQVLSVPCPASDSTDSSGPGMKSYLVVYGGSSPELGPLGDTYYAELPPGGIKSKLYNDLIVSIIRLRGDASFYTYAKFLRVFSIIGYHDYVFCDCFA